MTAHTAKAEMLIRRPVEVVFAAFVDPQQITRFWLDGTTGPLVEHARVEWRFKVPGAVETVEVTAFVDQRLIAFDWSDGIRVTLTFAAHGDGATHLAVSAAGFQDVDGAVNATEGFGIVLCDLKVLLETGRAANLVKDKAELIAAAA